MSDTYHYEDGAIHNDHKRVLHIGSVGSGDLQQLLHGFFQAEAEEAEVVECGEDGGLPLFGQEIEACLCTEEAGRVWQRLRTAGFIVPDGYALAHGVSNNQAAYIADRMAERLGITPKWKPFQTLWGIKNMAQLAGSWAQTGKLPPRAREIDALFK